MKMTGYRYSYQGKTEGIARAILKDLPISPKHTIELCARLRGKSVEFAKLYLQEVIKGERAVKFTRFTGGAGHKAAIGPGKFPEKASKELLKAIEFVESIAINKGQSKDLKIVHFSAQRASAPLHYGRQRRRQMKRTHLEVVVAEVQKKVVSKKIEEKQPVTEKVEQKPIKEPKKEVKPKVETPKEEDKK